MQIKKKILHNLILGLTMAVFVKLDLKFHFRQGCIFVLYFKLASEDISIVVNVKLIGGRSVKFSFCMVFK